MHLGHWITMSLSILGASKDLLSELAQYFEFSPPHMALSKLHTIQLLLESETDFKWRPALAQSEDQEV